MEPIGTDRKAAHGSRKSLARKSSAHCAREMDTFGEPSGPYCASEKLGPRTTGRALTNSICADAAFAIWIFSRRGSSDGVRFVANARDRHSRAGVRGLPRPEFRGIRLAGTPAGFRYQRFRRDP